MIPIVLTVLSLSLLGLTLSSGYSCDSFGCFGALIMGACWLGLNFLIAIYYFLVKGRMKHNIFFIVPYIIGIIMLFYGYMANYGLRGDKSGITIAFIAGVFISIFPLESYTTVSSKKFFRRN